MGYYVRVFCKSEKIPTIRQILDWTKSQGYELSIAQEFNNVDIDSDKWEQVGILYKENKLPFLSEVNRDDGNKDCLMREEIEEFKECLSEKKDIFSILNKRKVLQHLNQTQYIIANQIPTFDFEDEGYDYNSVFLEYFVVHCGGMIQADGEGFYDHNKLIIKMD